MRRATTVLIAAVALVSIVAAGLVAAGCGSGGSGSVPSDSVATVGGVAVSKTDFQQLLTQAQTQMKAQGMNVPKEGTPSYDHYAAQIVNFLVQEQIVAQSAKQLGVQVTDKEVNDQLAQLQKAYGGEAKVLALLKSQGMTLDLLKRSIRSQTLSSRAAAIVTKKATVSDAEIQAYWNAHKTAARQGEEDGHAGQGQDDHPADAPLGQAAAAVGRLDRRAVQGPRGRVRQWLRSRHADGLARRVGVARGLTESPARA